MLYYYNFVNIYTKKKGQIWSGIFMDGVNFCDGMYICCKITEFFFSWNWFSSFHEFLVYFVHTCIHMRFFFNHLDKKQIKCLWSKCFFSCFKTLTRRSWHPSEWPIFDTKTFVSNFAASTVITNLLPGQKKLRNYSHKSLLAAAAEYFVDHLKRCGVAFFQTS